MHSASRPVDLHGDSADMWAQIRVEVYGIDARQHGWSTRVELDAAAVWLDLTPTPCFSMWAAERVGQHACSLRCRLRGSLESTSQPRLIRLGVDRSAPNGAEDRVRLVAADAASEPLCFPLRQLDAINCVDVVPHLVPLDSVLAAGVGCSSGTSSRIVVIDPIIPGGDLADAEFALRTGGVHYEPPVPGRIRRSADSSRS